MRTFTPRHEIITMETVQSWNPCSAYTPEKVRTLVGDGITLEKFRTLPLPPADALWCLLHVEAIGERLCHEASCVFAERVIELYWPNPDQRSVNAIAVKRRWMAGDATDDELAAAGEAAGEAAEAAAWAAAREAAGESAWEAAEAADWAAARESAWEAAEAAARAAARESAWEAARAAARESAWEAAEAAARAAAWENELLWQLAWIWEHVE